jgi:hypothetical protein
VNVLIVSRNEETAHSLQAYFESRSLRVVKSTRLEPLKGQTIPTALVVFPDEFPKGKAEVGLVDLAQHYPEASVTVVTADTQRFTDLGSRLDERALRRWLVLPRPAFSWTIFDHVVAPVQADDRTRDI